jgi:hypothetical protein
LRECNIHGENQLLSVALGPTLLPSFIINILPSFIINIVVVATKTQPMSRRMDDDAQTAQRLRTRLSRVHRNESVATDVSNSDKGSKQKSEAVGAAAGHEETYLLYY